MRKGLAVLVVCLVALAGCSTGDTGSTPTPKMDDDQTETGTDTMSDTTPTEEIGTESGTGDDGTSSTAAGFNNIPGVENGEVTNGSALVNATDSRMFEAPTDFEITVENTASPRTRTITYRTDGEQLLIEFFEPTGTAFYMTEDSTIGQYNMTTGETTYGDNSTGLPFTAIFMSEYISQGPVGQLALMEWETAGTTTIDGEEAYVFESNTVNQSKSDNESTLETPTSASARLVVRPDGVMHEASLEAEYPGGDTDFTYNLRTDASIEVTQPDWFDEEAANATAK